MLGIVFYADGSMEWFLILHTCKIQNRARDVIILLGVMKVNVFSPHSFCWALAKVNTQGKKKPSCHISIYSVSQRVWASLTPVSSAPATAHLLLFCWAEGQSASWAMTKLCHVRKCQNPRNEKVDNCLFTNKSPASEHKCGYVAVCWTWLSRSQSKAREREKIKI